MPRNIAASKIDNGVISLLWQILCHCIPDHDKFSSLSNKTVVAIFPNVCLWRRSYTQNWEILTLKNCYGIEQPSYASTAYVAALCGPRFFSTVRFVKIWATCENFFGQMVYRPPWQKISRTPMYKTWRIIYMWNKTLARLEPAKVAVSPFFESRVPFQAWPTFFHINVLAHPARSTRSRRHN